MANEARQEGPQLPGHQTKDAQHHYQRVPGQVTRLNQPSHASKRTHCFSGTVHQGAINDGHVPHLPQTSTQRASTSSQDVFVEPIQEVLVFHDAHQRC